MGEAPASQPCPHCGTKYPGSSGKCSLCGSDLGFGRAPAREPRAAGGRWRVAVLLVGAFAVLVVAATLGGRALGEHRKVLAERQRALEKSQRELAERMEAEAYLQDAKTAVEALRGLHTAAQSQVSHFMEDRSKIDLGYSEYRSLLADAKPAVDKFLEEHPVEPALILRLCHDGASERGSREDIKQSMDSYEAADRIWELKFSGHGVRDRIPVDDPSAQRLARTYPDFMNSARTESYSGGQEYDIEAAIHFAWISANARGTDFILGWEGLCLSIHDLK